MTATRIAVVDFFRRPRNNREILSMTTFADIFDSTIAFSGQKGFLPRKRVKRANHFVAFT